MAKLVVLWPAEASVRIGQAEAAELARLGATSIGLLRDERMVGVVLDGWAFDPVRQAEAAIATLSPERPVARLFPVAEIGVTNAAHAHDGGQNDPTPPRPGRRTGGRRTAGA